MKLAKIAPLLAGGLALAAVGAAMLPPRPVRGFDVDAFGHLPVLEGGRVKPVDSVARNALLMIRSQQSFRFEGRTVSADEWLLDLLFRPEVADQQPVFVINDPDVLGLMGLKQTSDRYFSFRTMGPHLEEIQRQAAAAQPVDAKQRTRFQSAVVNLFDRAYLYYRLKNTVQLERSGGLAAELAAPLAPGAAARQEALAELAFFRPLPPAPGQRADAWRSVGEALRSPAAADGADLQALARASIAWGAQDPAAFDRALADLTGAIRAARPEALSQSSSEVLFNRAEPFYLGMVIYVLALLVLFASWAWKPEILQPSAFALLLAGAVVHTGGLVSRVVLQGRPPVTNLYSSAVFVGWGAVVLGVILERIYRKGFGTAVAAAAGFASLIVAHHLTGDGDTMEMMRAVLDSNFWLATHVVTITIGYSGTFLAGAIAIAYTLRRHLAPRLDPATTRTLVSMTYGVVCFALFFSFVGTVLGGIWADQSWGRFWGWDPKENGALLIVLWNAIILHARWGGYVREKGIMAMAIFGNVITSLSWFGVNMLGVGLHSYGFMDKAFWALAAFIGSQLAVMGFCLLPRHFWKGSAAGAAGEGGGQAAKPV
ncbi:MAG TPA: cytochrome c biogenesis protein CcsA [Anaeromyxobacteraceae bacterium]|jgi:ABC-type transport system involved in cytochrome c biogenesis permease subunit|nr:cytochrome c biogenesis protein CcsA [Anaeromyxobacteraceae bacterium]